MGTPGDKNTDKAEGSSDAAKGAGLFIGGALVGALGVILAVIAGLGGPLQAFADQIRANFPA